MFGVSIFLSFSILAFILAARVLFFEYSRASSKVYILMLVLCWFVASMADTLAWSEKTAVFLIDMAVGC